MAAFNQHVVRIRSESAQQLTLQAAERSKMQKDVRTLEEMK